MSVNRHGYGWRARKELHALNYVKVRNCIEHFESVLIHAAHLGVMGRLLIDLVGAKCVHTFRQPAPGRFGDVSGKMSDAFI